MKFCKTRSCSVERVDFVCLWKSGNNFIIFENRFFMISSLSDFDAFGFLEKNFEIFLKINLKLTSKPTTCFQKCLDARHLLFFKKKEELINAGLLFGSFWIEIVEDEVVGCNLVKRFTISILLLFCGIILKIRILPVLLF